MQKLAMKEHWPFKEKILSELEAVTKAFMRRGGA